MIKNPKLCPDFKKMLTFGLEYDSRKNFRFSQRIRYGICELLSMAAMRLKKCVKVFFKCDSVEEKEFANLGV